MNKLTIFVYILLMVILSSFASAIEVWFQPGATNGTDIYIEDGTQADQNNAGSASIRWGTDGGRIARALINMSFVFDSIPLGVTINNFTLSLKALECYGGGTAVDIYPMTNPWNESTITWNSCGDGGCVNWYDPDNEITLTSYSPATNGKWYNFSLSTVWAENENAKDAGDRYGILINGTETGSGDVFCSFDSSDQGDAARRPVYYVKYIIPDTDPPYIQNATLTSGDVTNTSSTKIYSMNFSVDDETGVDMLRCANDSSLTFVTAGSSRNGTKGAGNTWIWSAPESDQLSVYYVNQPYYCWANDTLDNYHTTYNLTFNMMLINSKPTQSTPILNTTSSNNYTTDNLTCFNQSTSDSEGHTVTNHYRWFNGSNEITAFGNLTVIGSGNTTKGETWICEITAYDFLNHSAPLNSTPLLIRNTPPIQPTIIYPVSGGNYSSPPDINYSSARDDDSDPITYQVYINGTLNRTTAENITGLNISDGFYNLTVTANDGYNSSANSTVTHFRIDTTAPSFSNQVRNETPDVNEYLRMNITITDDSENYYMFFWNHSGTFVNETEWCYQETANDSSVISHGVYGISEGECGIYTGTYGFTSGYTNPNNVIDGNWSTLGGDAGQNFTVNYTKPSNALEAMWRVKNIAVLPVNVSIPTECFDAFPNKIVLSIIDGRNCYCWNTTDFKYLHNMPATNQWVEEAMWWRIGYTSGQPVSTTRQVTEPHQNICWGYWANDTLGNSATSSLDCFTVPNTAPDQPTIIYPTNGKNYSSIPYINYSSGDADGDSLTYQIYINGTLNITMVDANFTGDLNISEGFYNLTVTANDDYDSSANSTVTYFRIDTTPPVIESIIYPENNSNISSNSIDLNASATDNFASSLTYYWIINGTTNSTTIDTNSTLDASDGYYNLTLIVSDSLFNVSSSIYFTLDITPPTVTIIYPTNQTNISSNSIDLNVSAFEARSPTLTYYFVINGTTNSTAIDGNSTLNASDGFYNLTVFVFDGLQNGSDSSFFRLDTTLPAISIGNGTNFSIDNSTIISNYLNNLSINITFFDINLVGGQILINITNETDESMYQILNTSITGTTVNYQETINISYWPLGNYTIKLVSTDAHTKEEIEEYDIDRGLDSLRYITKEGNDITIESLTQPISFKTKKKTDRYDFEFNYLISKETYTYRITSKNKINYIENSNYKAHFVVMGENNRGNWIDFDNPYLNKKDYKIKKIDDYIYEVKIKSKGKKNFKFESLGGLNTAEEHYFLRIGAVIDVWVYEGEEGDGLNATATIGSQYAHTVENTSAARLFNITKEITSLTLNSSGYGIETKTINITQSYHNLSFNMTDVNAIKAYFYDEKSNTLIDSETFSVYLESTNYSNLFSVTANPSIFRDLPTGLYEMKASSTNYQEKQYFNLDVSNESIVNLNVYLINATDSSEVTFYVRDSSITAIEDVDVVFARLINGSWTEIGSEQTDYDGACSLYLDSNYEYTINFSKTGYITKTISLEPVESSYVITLIGLVEEYNYSVYGGVKYSLEPSNEILNNDTNYNFTFTLNSSNWDITNCTLTLWNESILLSETSSYTSSSCYLRIEQNTYDMTNITSKVVYELNSLYNFTVVRDYRIIYTYEGEFSLKNFLDDLSDFGMAGFGDFGRMILALIVMFIITTLVAQRIGFANPEALIILVIAQVWFFSYVNWLYLGFTPIPVIAGFDLKKYIIAILITLAGGAFLFEKLTK